MVDTGRTTVLVNNVDPTAQAVIVYAFAAGNPPTLIGEIGRNEDPGGNTLVSVDVSANPLVQGNIIRATQTLLGIEGCVPTTGGRTVGAAGVIEDFEGPVLRYDHPSPGVSGAWYDIAYNSYTDVLIPNQDRTTMPNGSKCVNITDHGWTNGAYVRYDHIIPATGEYHLILDMLIDEPANMDPDFYRQYQVGVIVNGAHREASAGVIPAIASPIGNYICLTPQRDGVGQDPQQVYVATFPANAGDSLLIAFSTHITDSGHTANKTATPAGYVGMKVDNIRLIGGPKPVLCTDVPPVNIKPTSSSPLEEGGPMVTVSDIDGNATNVKVRADNSVIADVDLAPGHPTQIDVMVDTDPVAAGNQPLVAGTTLTASQTLNGLESCQCPGVVGPMVGKGKNAQVKIALGIRETGCTSGCVIGGDGGISGFIEWVGASAKGTGGEPVGKLLETDPGWQTVTFRWAPMTDPDPVTGFTGNGTVAGAWGTLESLNITIDDTTNTGRYDLYIDEVKNGDVLITGFEGLTPGGPALFRAPRASGSTDTNLLIYPNLSAVDGSYAAEGSQSLHVQFQFLDNQAKRWVRLTSVYDPSAVPAMPTMPLQNALIDLTKPITMKLRLYGLPQCGLVFADQHPPGGDGDVDMDDYAMFQRCLTIVGTYPTECGCFDRVFNNVIDVNDLAKFNECASGAGVPATPNCGQ
ncbi:MAG: hypothetical protein HY718_04275 [Planctomycetes bacterium]|nr:hypothetical protein [Planctomycetota bacterium]